MALSMSVVLMGLVSFAIQFYTREMDTSDVEVRRMQLVTAVMQMIEDDLRSALHTEPADMSGLESLLSSFGGGDTGGGTATGGDTPPDDTMNDDTTAVVEDMTATDLSLGAAVLETPGLIGNQNQIQIDISRLPRLEEYMPMIDGQLADLQDVPSDIKTVAYFVQAPGVVTGVKDELDSIGQTASVVDPSANPGGLIRRVLDRAATMHASISGGTGQLNATGDLLAPEVIGLEFEYWDGMIWQIQWSSDEMGELPLAVRVTLAIGDAATGADSTETDPATATVGARTFQHIIRLPMAKMIETEDELMTGTTL